MIGILVVTHGNLGRELIRSGEIIVGQQEQVESLGLFHNDSVSELQQKIKEKYTTLDQGKGVLILTDIFGGSPSNSIAFVLQDQHYACVTGVNLPMMIEAMLNRDESSLEELREKCLQVGREGVKDLRAIMELDVPV